MYRLIIAIIAIFLLPIIIEDFRYRKISLFWLLGLVVLAICYQISGQLSIKHFITNTSVNVSVIIFHCAILTIYFSIKNIKIVDLRKKHLGIGDIFFLIAISFLFSPINFLFFFLFSLVFSLFMNAITRFVVFNKSTTIPLAGLQALFLLLLLVIVLFTNMIIELNDDEFIIAVICKYAGIK